MITKIVRHCMGCPVRDPSLYCHLYERKIQEKVITDAIKPAWCRIAQINFMENGETTNKKR